MCPGWCDRSQKLKERMELVSGSTGGGPEEGPMNGQQLYQLVCNFIKLIKSLTTVYINNTGTSLMVQWLRLPCYQSWVCPACHN